MIDLAKADLSSSERQAIARRLRVVLPGILMIMFLASLDIQVVNTALPRIVSELGGLSHLSWISTSFTVAAAAATPLCGKLGDMYGRKPMLVGILTLFLTASILCGLSTTLAELIIFRGVQGAGAGGLIVLCQTVIADIIPPRERGRYQGIFAAVSMVSSISGPLVGGVLTTLLSWRWVFFINIPLGLSALGLLVLGLKVDHDRHAHRIDYLGAALLTAATVCGLVALNTAGASNGLGSPVMLGLLLAAFILAGLFFYFEPRADEPIIALHLFRNPVFSVSLAVTFTMALAMASALVFLPLYFQLVLGRTPAESGMMILPQIIGVLLSSTIGGHLASRFGQVRPLMIGGLSAQVAALVAIAAATIVGAAPFVLVGAIGLFGLGTGLSAPMTRLAVQNTVTRRELGVATSGQAYTQSLGGSLGMTLGGTLMALQLQHQLTIRAPGVDRRALVEHGVAALSHLSPLVRAAAADAYRLSLSSNYVMGAIAISVALMLALWMPSEVLRSRQD